MILSTDFIHLLTEVSNEFYYLIDKPTRITSNATLIDKIVPNVHSHVLSPAIWLTDISYHLPVLVTIPTKIKIQQFETYDNFFYNTLINESTDVIELI